jgi:hypothetical protein
MAFPENRDLLDQPIRTMRIILVALIVGVLFFMGFVIFQRQAQNQPAAPQEPLVTYVALANAGMILVAFFLLPRFLTASLRRGPTPFGGAGGSSPQMQAEDTFRLRVLWHTRTLLRAALLEGATFFLLVAYLLEGMDVSLMVACLFVAGLACLFPARAGVENWMERQRLLLEEERMTGARKGIG